MKVTLTRTVPDKLTTKGWAYRTESFKVEVMAKSDGYAMVRHGKAFVPFICEEKELGDE
jgi:hypothetical protein